MPESQTRVLGWRDAEQRSPVGLGLPRICAWYIRNAGRVFAILLIPLGAMAWMGTPPAFACTLSGSTWAGGPSGLWGVGSNWNTGVVPNDPKSPPNVCIDNDAAVTLGFSHVVGIKTFTFGIGVDIATLEVDPGNTLTLIVGTTGQNSIGTSTLNMFGPSIILGGQITIVGGGASIDLNVSASLTGGGTLTLSNSNALIQAAVNGVTLTNSDTIDGFGNIGNLADLALVNQGVINANTSVGTLWLSNNGVTTNTGLLEATNGGTLTISADTSTVDNVGGNITANGGTVLLESTTIQGGTLTQTGSGVLDGTDGALLDGSTFGPLTLNGTYTIPGAGAVSEMKGVINNNGNILVAGGPIGSGTFASLWLEGDTTLQDGGAITLSTISGGSLAVLSPAPGLSLTLTNINNTIQGAGSVGFDGPLVLNNEAGGVIDANSTGGSLAATHTLEFDSGSLTNSGTLEVGPGNTMLLGSAFGFTNFSDNTLTGGTYIVNGTTAPATLQIDVLGSTGGEIVNDAANIVLNGQNAHFVDEAGLNALSGLASVEGTLTLIGMNDSLTPSGGALTNSGTVNLQNASTFAVTGSVTNNGTINLGNGMSDTGNSSFTVSGILTNNNTINLDAFGDSMSADLNNNDPINMNASGQKVTDTGDFNDNSGGQLNMNAANDKVAVAGNFNNGAGGAVNFNGGSSGSSIGVTGAFSNTGGVVTMAGSGDSLNSNGFTNSSSGQVTIGAGETINTGTGNYTQSSSGTTTGVDGTLQTVQAIIQAGTVSGNGKIIGNVSNTGGVVNPFAAGNPATLAITGNYMQSAGGVLMIDLGGTGAGQFTVLALTGTASLSGTVDFTSVNGFTPTVGDDFTFMDYGSHTGTLSSVNFTGFSCPGTCTDVYGANSVTLEINKSISPTPEPGSLVLLGLGGVAMVDLLRRRGHFAR